MPDIITSAKGLTSGYSPLGAMVASDRLFEPFNDGKTTCRARLYLWRAPGFGRGGDGQPRHLRARGHQRPRQGGRPGVPATLEKLYDLPIVGDVRGEGFFYGIELVKDKATKETFNDEESERLLRGFLTPALWEAGLYCRADDRGDPVIQLAPPLISGQTEFDAIYEILHSVLSEAGKLL